MILLNVYINAADSSCIHHHLGCTQTNVHLLLLHLECKLMFNFVLLDTTSRTTLFHCIWWVRVTMPFKCCRSVKKRIIEIWIWILDVSLNINRKWYFIASVVWEKLKPQFTQNTILNAMVTAFFLCRCWMAKIKLLISFLLVIYGIKTKVDSDAYERTAQLKSSIKEL